MRALGRKLATLVTRGPAGLSRRIRSMAFTETVLDHPIPVAPLVSPLRYDLVVRQQYYRFLQSNRNLYDTDFPAYVAAAKEQPYFRWFRDVACARFAPELLNDPVAFEAAFVARLRRGAALHDSYRQNGLQPSQPIELCSGREIQPTSSGKVVRRRFYPGDGCHRIALLLFDNRAEIPPGCASLRLFPSYQPLDNTRVLIGSLGIDAPSYWRYLSLAYADVILESEDALRQHILETNPARSAEFEQVARIDRPALDAVRQRAASAAS